MSGMKKKRIELRLWLRRIGLGLLLPFTMVNVPQAASMQQQTFATPESAVEALVAANRSSQAVQLLHILGPHSAKLIFSGDFVADKNGRKKFVEAYDAAHKLEHQGEDRCILVVGAEAWPLPIPIIRKGSVWRFDTAAGEQEILNRRIGRNELSVIQVCRAYVEAQREFAEKNRHAGGRLEYARRLHSTRGKHDGLYWQTKPGEEASPLGPLIAAAEVEGYGARAVQENEPYHGYLYKIINSRSDKESSDARKSTVTNQMASSGYALIAFPAKFGDSGIMTFIINQDGIVYEKNFGPDTAKIARKITQYHPDSTWKIYQSTTQ